MDPSIARAVPLRWRVAFLTMVLVLGAPPTAIADDIYAKYGQRGYYWLAKYSSGDLWVSSNRCNSRELKAFERVLTSTAGTAEFAGRWPDGLDFKQKRCDGKISAAIDIRINYSDFDHTHKSYTNGVWAENHSKKAPREWCNVLDTAHPCGSHPSNVHIDLDNWNKYDDLWRERLIMHETGHSVGLAHHCFDDAGNPQDSIMNHPPGKGTSCSSANWTKVLVYKPTDRDGVVRMYPNWPLSSSLFGPLGELGLTVSRNECLIADVPPAESIVGVTTNIDMELQVVTVDFYLAEGDYSLTVSYVDPICLARPLLGEILNHAVATALHDQLEICADLAEQLVSGPVTMRDHEPDQDKVHSYMQRWC